MTAAASGNLRGNGVTLASSSTHPAVTPTVIRAPAASSAATIHSHADAGSSSYGPQRLIGGMYFRNRKFPGNGMRSGPSGSRVIPYTSKRLEAAPTSSSRRAAAPPIEHLLVHARDLGRGALPPEERAHARAVGRAELLAQALVAQELQDGAGEAARVVRLAQEAALACAHHLGQRSAVRYHHGALAGHRLGHGEPEPL